MSDKIERKAKRVSFHAEVVFIDSETIPVCCYCKKEGTQDRLKKCLKCEKMACDYDCFSAAYPDRCMNCF